MKRKDFIKKTALGITGIASIGAAVSSCKNEALEVPKININSNKVFNWRMTTVWGKNFPVFGESCNLLAEWVHKMSAGRLNIKVFGAGELAPGLQTFYSTSVGTTEMGAGASYYWQGISPAAPFFTAVPFGMNAQQILAWLIGGEGEGYQLWKEVYAPFNLLPLLAGNSGVQMGGWFNKEINTIADLEGLKMRIPGLAGKVLEKAGGAAITVPSGEIYTNLERGVIDATEWVGPYHDYKLGLNKAAKYYYTPGWHETGSQLEFLVNKKAHDSLPSDLQEILFTASLRVQAWVLAEFDAQNGAYLEKILESGTVIKQFPEDVLRVLKEKTDEVLEELTASDPMAKKVYASYNAFRKKINVWSELTEKSFYNNIVR